MDGPANGPLSFTPLQSVSSVAQLAAKQFRNTSRSQEVGVRRPGGRRQESGGWQEAGGWSQEARRQEAGVRRLAT